MAFKNKRPEAPTSRFSYLIGSVVAGVFATLAIPFVIGGFFVGIGIGVFLLASDFLLFWMSHFCASLYREMKELHIKKWYASTKRPVEMDSHFPHKQSKQEYVHSGYTPSPEQKSPIVPPSVPPSVPPLPAVSEQSMQKESSSFYIEPQGCVTSESIRISTISELRSFKNYIVLDVETTGLDRQRDQIVEIGILSVRGGNPVDEYEKLVNPGCHIPDDASAVNGITDADVSGCPSMLDISPDVWERIDKKIMVGYNASFDAAFVSRAMALKGYNGVIQYVDAMALVKRAYKGLSSYRLEAVAKHLGFQGKQSHRALDDAKLTYFVLNMSIKKILQEHEDELKKKKEEQEYQERLRQEKFPLSPLVNKTIAFTGDFKMDRHQLEDMLENVGAVLKNSVTKKLDYLVVGDVSHLPEWALERKINKADRYISEGCPIVKLTEGEYLHLIGNALNSMK